jgi:hypothetical protein
VTAITAVCVNLEITTETQKKKRLKRPALPYWGVCKSKKLYLLGPFKLASILLGWCSHRKRRLGLHNFLLWQGLQKRTLVSDLTSADAMVTGTKAVGAGHMNPRFAPLMRSQGSYTLEQINS